MKNKTKITYSANFNKAFQSLIMLEGCYSNDALDNGKETKYGITKRDYPHLDIKELSIDQAKEIYHRDYWIVNQYNKIRSIKIAEKVFHMTVNAGSRQSHLILQRALHAVEHQTLVEDGILGSITIEATNKANPRYLLPALRSELAGFYRLIIATRPSQGKFKNGWLKRAYS